MRMLNDALRKAVCHLLETVQEVVEDLVLIEVDWGDDTPPVTNEIEEITFQGAAWLLVYADSELVLRQVLCRAGADGRVIIVLPAGNGFQVPLDIQARAHRGASWQLGLRHRLCALTDRGWPPEVDYADWHPSIERHFDALVRSVAGAGLKWTIALDDLKRSLVHIAFGLRVEGQQPAELLARLVTAENTSTTAPTALEISLLNEQLRLHQVRWPEILTWVAEEAGRAKMLIRTGVMMGAEQAAHLMPSWGKLTRLRALLVQERQLPEKDAITAVIELATQALQHVHRATRESLVESAQTELNGVLPPDSYNIWFPDALERKIEEVAYDLSRRNRDAAEQASQLHQHLFASKYQLRLSALDEMAELINGWEMEMPSADELVSVSDYGNWYLRQGSCLDLRQLNLMRRQQQGVGLDDPIEYLSRNVWHWRDQLNVGFAGQLLEHYEEALHDRHSGVFGIHRLLDWIVRPLLEDGQHVLLLVMDGMGCAAFWHLADQWASQAPAPVYVRQVQPLLALLPSVTSVSRKGLFLNALPTDRLDDEQAYQTKARAKETESLERAFPDHRVSLYNKTNLGIGQQLFDELQFNGADVIGVILNAIDDDLKSTTTSVRLPRLEDLGLLPNAVRRALERGWTVILTSDHGHTWHRDKQLRRGEIASGGGERFAPIASVESLPQHAIATQDPHIVRLQEGKQVALLTATGSYFGRAPRRGYHGGVGLEEVIIPCAVLGYEAPHTEPTEGSDTGSQGRSPVATYDLAGVVLTLPDDRAVRLDLPFALSPLEAKILQTLARLREASEAELKQALGTRRIAGPLASLRDRLANAGPDYDLIEDKGAGPEGSIYRFRTEILK